MHRRDHAATDAGHRPVTAVGRARPIGVAADADLGRVVEQVPFKLKFAPHPGQFRNLAGRDYCDQIRFAAQVGFTAWEDCGMMGRPVDLQKRVAKVLHAEGMTMGVIAGYMSFNRPTFANPDMDVLRMLRRRLRQVVECAKRVDARWISIVPGTRANQLGWNRQTRNVVETLKWCAEFLAGEGMGMVLKAHRSTAGSHPSCFLTDLAQAREICRAVNSPSCKILASFGGRQIEGAEAISQLDRNWDEIAALQVSEHPGLAEPRGGGIDYSRIFKHLHRKGFQGVVGMEHGHSQDGKVGEIRLIQAYRDAEHITF